MHETVKLTWLRIFLRLVAGGMLAAFIPWIAIILLKAPLLAPGSALAPLLRFQPYNPHYESMLAAVYIVWAAMLWRAAGDPGRHHLFLDFTAWGSTAHALVMLAATPMQKGLVMTLVEGVPFLVLAAGLLWLRPEARAESRAGSPSVSTTTRHRRDENRRFSAGIPGR